MKASELMKKPDHAYFGQKDIQQALLLKLSASKYRLNRNEV